MAALFVYWLPCSLVNGSAFCRSLCSAIKHRNSCSVKEVRASLRLETISADAPLRLNKFAKVFNQEQLFVGVGNTVAVRAQEQ